jgi:hypothetical protein
VHAHRAPTARFSPRVAARRARAIAGNVHHVRGGAQRARGADVRHQKRRERGEELHVRRGDQRGVGSVRGDVAAEPGRVHQHAPGRVLALEDRVDSTLKLAHVERLCARRRLFRRRHLGHRGARAPENEKARCFSRGTRSSPALTFDRLIHRRLFGSIPQPQVRVSREAKRNICSSARFLSLW